MFWETTNPLTSRDRFATRAYLIRVVIAVLFLLTVSVLSWFLAMIAPSKFIPMLVMDAIALGASYFFYLVWKRQPIRLRCDCEEIISSRTPWVCAECDHKNRNTTIFPFVNQCEECGAEPKSYECHHCGKIVFLSDDHDKTNCARRLKKEEPDEHTQTLKTLREKRTEKDVQLAIARIEEELNAARKRIRDAKQKKKSAKETLQADVDSIMDLEEAERELSAAYAEKYRGDSVMVRRMKAALKESVLRQKGEGK